VSRASHSACFFIQVIPTRLKILTIDFIREDWVRFGESASHSGANQEHILRAATIGRT
jgi:hypothetical protein